MLPAHQGLEADRQAAGDVDLRLVVQQQLVLGHRLDQLVGQRQSFGAVFVGLVIVNAYALGKLLGLVHGHVGGTQQRMAVAAVLGVARHTDAGAEAHLDAFHQKRLIERRGHLVCDARGPLAIRPVTHQHRKLVASEA